jgi:drug/metabolite transporter (DMT)-like permease
LAALFALAGALLWGVGDFLGGISSRRVAVLTVLALSQAVGLAGVAVWIMLAGDPVPGAADLLPAAGAGIAGLVGLGALYRGLSIGAMGIVAPISAAGPVVPLVLDAAQGVVPGPLQFLGVVLVLAGIAALSVERTTGDTRRIAEGAGLAVVAALGFGVFFVGIDSAADASVAWTVGTARAFATVAALAAVAATSASLVPPRAVVPAIVAVGVFDTGANLCVAFATTEGAVGIVAILSALYPVVTVVLARVFLDERLTVTRRVAAVAALAGAALIAAG